MMVAEFNVEKQAVVVMSDMVKFKLKMVSRKGSEKSIVSERLCLTVLSSGKSKSKLPMFKILGRRDRLVDYLRREKKV